MTPHENIDVFLSGEKPQRIPLSIYGALCKASGKPADWAPLFERGLVPTHLGATYASSAKDVETVTDTYEEDEVMTLYEAFLEEFRKIVEIVAEGPGGRFVNCPENFTAETLGPARYERFLLPVYKTHFPVLHQAGKIVGTHYDGKLSSTKYFIAEAPIDVIESLTEPPEGDMTLAECRAAWPEKLFWNNINLGRFDLPPDQLKADIRRRIEDAAPDGRRLAFEISEDLPVNWQGGIPAIMDELGY